jgi:hypothetical protein
MPDFCPTPDMRVQGIHVVHQAMHQEMLRLCFDAEISEPVARFAEIALGEPLPLDVIVKSRSEAEVL